jgi:hypothetical protein
MHNVIRGLYAAASVVLGWNGEAVASVALIGTDPELGRANNAAALALRRVCDRLSHDAGAPDLRIAA